MKNFKFWTLQSSKWIEQDNIRAKNRKEAALSIKGKYKLGTWKIRVVS